MLVRRAAALTFRGMSGQSMIQKKLAPDLIRGLPRT